MCDIAEQSRTEREQPLVENCPGKSPALCGSSSHSCQISDLTHVSCTQEVDEALHTKTTPLIFLFYPGNLSDDV